jgi:hypothetical protein
MADDLKKTGRQDDERINIDQEHELGFSQALTASAPSPLVKATRRSINAERCGSISVRSLAASLRVATALVRPMRAASREPGSTRPFSSRLTTLSIASPFN